MTGPNGVTWPVYGLVDTGADFTSLPLSWAVVLGYELPHFVRMQDGKQVQGTLSMWGVNQTSQAIVRGMPHRPFEIDPVFIPGAQSVLWGRRDFLMRWTLELREADSGFTIAWRP